MQPSRFPRPPVWFWVAVVAGAIATSLVAMLAFGVRNRASENEDRIGALEAQATELRDGAAVVVAGLAVGIGEAAHALAGALLDQPH